MSVGKSLLIDMQKRHSLGVVVEMKNILVTAEKLGDAAELLLEAFVPRYASHSGNLYK